MLTAFKIQILHAHTDTIYCTFSLGERNLKTEQFGLLATAPELEFREFH